MKKFAIVFLLLGAACALAALFGLPAKTPQEADRYLRVHIRADSNEEEAQRVKYRVRDAVVAYLTPAVAECEGKKEAMEKIGQELPALEEVAEKVLRENGFSYGAHASLKREEFPTRVYEGATLEAGVYDALILELGSGKGDNWWCVVYPPLCFSGGNGNIVYKSKIAELVRKFFGN